MTTEPVRVRYPRSYAPTYDPLARESQLLRHIAISIHDSMLHLRDLHLNRHPRANFASDHESQVMLINNRLVVSSNLNYGSDLLFNAADATSAAPFMTLLRLERSARNLHLYGAEKREREIRVGGARAKLEQAFNGDRVNAVAAVLRANRQVHLADAGSDETRLRNLLTLPEHRNSVIFLQHSGAADTLHAELKLIAAVANAGLTAEHITGPFMIHGKFRPCMSCWVTLGHLAATHQHQRDQLVAATSPDPYRAASIQPLHFNQNHGAYYRRAMEQALRFVPRVAQYPDGRPEFPLHAITARLQDPFGLVSAPSYSRQQPPPHAVMGPAWQYGLETREPSEQISAVNYETASDSDAESDGPGSTTRNLDITQVLAGRNFGPTVRRRFLTAQEQKQLRDIVTTANRLRGKKPQLRLLAEFTNLVQQFAERGVNDTEMAEAAAVSTRTVRSHRTRPAQAAVSSAYLDEDQQRAAEGHARRGLPVVEAAGPVRQPVHPVA